MDFSYFNNDNEKVRLNISVGLNWNELNIQNERLNSIFAKIDDGDKIISENEFNLLEKLLNKADSLINPSYKLLENKELDEVIKQIEDSKIKLPKKEQTEELQYSAQITSDRSYSDEDIKKYKENPIEFKKKELEDVKEGMRKHFTQYPEDKYDMKVLETEHFGRYKVYFYAKDKNLNQTLAQTNTVLRADGIELVLRDYYSEEIKDDENVDYSKIHQSANFGKFTITDKNGKKHELNYRMSDFYNRDVLDCRRATQKVCEFLANLPEKLINELIEKNVTDISFASELDELYLPEVKNRLQKEIDKNGYAVNIMDDFAEFVCPKLTIENRKPKDLSFERKDGYKIDIKDNDSTSSTLTIKSKGGKSYDITLQGTYDSTYHTWQLPKLKNMLSELPEDVLNDLSNEISGITFMDRWGSGNGEYVIGSNLLAYKADYDWETPTISFVHEIGHAIDDKNGTMFSESPEFSVKFEKFKKLLQKLNLEENYAMDNPAEFFASIYAYLNYSQEKILNNHIAEIAEQVEKFKTSKNPEEKECWELFSVLKSDVQKHVNEVRNQSQTERADNKIRNLVQTECKEILAKISEYNISGYFSGNSVEADIISTLSAKDEDYNKSLKYYEKFSNNNFKNELDIKIDLPEELSEQFKLLIEKIKELRESQ